MCCVHTYRKIVQKSNPENITSYFVYFASIFIFIMQTKYRIAVGLKGKYDFIGKVCSKEERGEKERGPTSGIYTDHEWSMVVIMQ